MRVCVVGGGGREHALAHVLGRSCEVVVTPGNAGIVGSTPVPAEEIAADLYVIGPEAPLVEGLADKLRARGKLVFGPGADGARLEGSKGWMKQLLVSAGVPTAAHGTFSEAAQALKFLDTLGDLFVIKTDGLAAGKGVLVTEDRAEADAAVRDYISGEAFGDAGRRVVIEEGLSGPELSLLALCDGNRAVCLAPAQDFKRVGEGDVGPNTGGMGAYSPVPQAPLSLVEEVMERAVLPTLAELQKRGIDYRGVLYAGLMLTTEGVKVLEYNVRFGDPEAQVVLPRLHNDLAEMLAQAAAGQLCVEPLYSDDAAVTVVCAAQGYPGSARVGDAIQGIEAANASEGVTVFCAGVASAPVAVGAPHKQPDSFAEGDKSLALRGGGLVTAGGRVLSVTGQGLSLAAARERAYGGVAQIDWPGRYFRGDIALAGISDNLERSA
ncbi:MAG: phosphoribosylamine--glycine ligase [Acidimicrobiia bacterium]|nr:phosphoribosylamine--glycine ligase [Acidimicrobiia bacterium]MYC57512.1 phosphoribosylamine--glycine ligase [Acidimicrobiia bacterium]MYI29774.1 phosphoribosylamine--glycine ligase [Acidimicrobiia bacterium]